MPYQRPIWKTTFGRDFVGKTPSWRVLTRRGFVELFSTSLLVFAAVLGSNNVVVNGAAAIGITATLMIASFVSISGCHMNPAVSLALLISGSISGILELLTYVSAQLVGSVFGALIGRLVMNETEYLDVHGGMTMLDDSSVNVVQGIALEAVITAQLTLTILCTAKIPSTAPLFVGLSIFCGILIGGKMTGGSMNPARSFGPSVVYQMSRGGGFYLHHYIYWAGPLTGAVIAALLWKLVFGDEKDRWNVMERIFGAKDDNDLSGVKLRSMRYPLVEYKERLSGEFYCTGPPGAMKMQEYPLYMGYCPTKRNPLHKY